MIKTKGVLHLTIPVSDPARSRAFYTDILGLEFVGQVPQENPHFVFLKSGNDYVVLGRDASRFAVDLSRPGLLGLARPGAGEQAKRLVERPAQHLAAERR